MKPLANPRHEAFCQFYVYGHPARNGARGGWRTKRTNNATRSYEAAGYSAKGNAATTAAVRLLRREDIKARIAELEAS